MEHEFENLKEYLLKRYKPKSVKNYLWGIEKFVEAVGYENCAHIKFKGVTDYIGTLREKKQSTSHIYVQLLGIKAFFKWLIKTGKRIDNPAATIYLVDSFSKPVQFQDLFTPEELKSLLHRKNRLCRMRYRYESVVNLLIYQGLTYFELKTLKVQNVDLERKEVYIESSTYTLSRILPLEEIQIAALENYIWYERPQLLKNHSQATDVLFLSRTDSSTFAHFTDWIFEDHKERFPGRTLNCITVRQSVIANKFKEGWSLRKVQLWAGCKNPSTAERYRPQNIEGLKSAIMEYHPLG